MLAAFSLELCMFAVTRNSVSKLGTQLKHKWVWCLNQC